MVSKTVYYTRGFCIMSSLFLYFNAFDLSRYRQVMDIT